MKSKIKALVCLYGLLLHSWSIGKLPKAAWGKYTLHTRGYSGHKKLPKEWSLSAPAGAPNSYGEYAQHIINASGVWDAHQQLYVIRSWAKNRDI